MPIASGGVSSAIISLVSSQPKILAVTSGSIYTTGGGSSGVNSLSLGTPASNAFTLSGATGNVTLNFANVGATPSTVFLRGDGTWSPASGGGSSIRVNGTTVNTPNFVNSLAGSATNTFTTDPSGNITVAPRLFSTNSTATFSNINVVGGATATVASDTLTITVMGGGGATLVASSAWGSGGTSKDAFLSPGNVNAQSIVISLVASSGSGGITGATVRLNNVALTQTYASTGTWPNLVVTVPAADLSGNTALTTSNVSVSISGTFAGSSFNVANAGALTNVQPVPFTTTLSASYTVSSLPYYTTTASISYAYTNTNAITSFGGTVVPTGGFAQNATSPSGTFTNQPINGGVISGNAVGNGTNGAGSSTINLSGTLVAATTFVPAFYQITTSSANPTWTTATTQTPRAAQGSTITYPLPAASTNYAWIATQRPLASILLVTPFGNTPVVPDQTYANVPIGTQNFTVYGFTRLATDTPIVLIIN